jgi:tetratricopeptide (TPR) repeat protein
MPIPFLQYFMELIHFRTKGHIMSQNIQPLFQTPVKAKPAPALPKPFSASEALIIMDDQTWIAETAVSSTKDCGISHIKCPSNILLRQSWSRFQATPFIILHWESKQRNGGNIIEEILEIDRRYDVADKIIVLTTNPVHEDVVFFSELGIRRIVKLRQRERDLALSSNEIKSHINEIINPNSKPNIEGLWRRIVIALDRLTMNTPETLLASIEAKIAKLREPGKPESARECEALAHIQFRRERHEDAIRLLNRAIQINPNYFRAWNTLILIRQYQGDHTEAYSLLQKMQLHNRGSSQRLVSMGEAQLALKDMRKAETLFKGALDKDPYSSRALNGLAEIKFLDDELDEARNLLSKSAIAYRFAAKMNQEGIELVKAGKFEKALEHYSKAQYVLPHQEKSPQLLYNIALCYAKWGKYSNAEEFLTISLIKEPNYKKAAKLLDQVRKRGQGFSHESMDVA